MLTPATLLANTHLRVCETRAGVSHRGSTQQRCEKSQASAGKRGREWKPWPIDFALPPRPGANQTNRATPQRRNCPLPQTTPPLLSLSLSLSLSHSNVLTAMRSSLLALVLIGVRHASGFVVAPGNNALARSLVRSAPPAPARCGASSSVAMSATKLVPFSKYQGLGNDFILVDNREAAEPMLTAGESANLCDR